jgi:hypothetical protein
MGVKEVQEDIASLGEDKDITIAGVKRESKGNYRL